MFIHGYFLTTRFIYIICYRSIRELLKGHSVIGRKLSCGGRICFFVAMHQQNFRGHQKKSSWPRNKSSFPRKKNVVTTNKMSPEIYTPDHNYGIVAEFQLTQPAINIFYFVCKPHRVQISMDVSYMMFFKIFINIHPKLSIKYLSISQTILHNYDQGCIFLATIFFVATKIFFVATKKTNSALRKSI